MALWKVRAVPSLLLAPILVGSIHGDAVKVGREGGSVEGKVLQVHVGAKSIAGLLLDSLEDVSMRTCAVQKNRDKNGRANGEGRGRDPEPCKPAQPARVDGTALRFDPVAPILR